MKLISRVLLSFVILISPALGSPITVHPNQVSGSNASAVALHDTPIGGSPLPYGYSNNLNDLGWIWEVGDELKIDFQAPVSLNKFRVWSTYTEGTRGAVWDIESSDDGLNFTLASSFSYLLTPGGGVNDDGSQRSDFGGWYEANFNSAADAHQYWKLTDKQTLAQHSPRSGEIQFFAKTVPESSPGIAGFLGCVAIMFASSACMKKRRDPKSGHALLDHPPRISGAKSPYTYTHAVAT